MGLLEDMLKALDRVEWWKELRGVPTRIDALEKKVAELEEKLGGKWPADVCKFCGERAVRLETTWPPNKGLIEQEWRCQKCGQYEHRSVRPASE